MADKKSFILYFDNKTQFDMLSDAQAGRLIKGIYEFACNGVTPQFDDGMVQMAFSFISSAIARDSEKYEERCRKNKEIAAKRIERQRNIAKENERVRTLTNVTDNDSDNVNENDNYNEKGNDNESETDSVSYNEQTANGNASVRKNPLSPSESVKKTIDIYHQICGNFSRITAITHERTRAVESLLSRYSEAEIKTMFEKASKSDFLNGVNQRSWKANFDWLINESNFLKVLEGNYDNREILDDSSASDGFYADKYAGLVNNF